nr:Lrp/AsnC family transcriptional regulator [Quadrisphaera sp. RL12-1S]
MLVDDIDRHILHELQLDGRMSNQDLADRVGLSPSPCLRRVRLLEQRGLITGYRAVVSGREVGLPITAFVRLRLVSHAPEGVTVFEERVRALPAVVEAYLLAGDHDYLLKVAVASFEAYELFVRTQLRAIPGVESIETTFAYGTTKPPSPLPVA